MGGVSYDIVAVDRTKEAIDSATQGVDSVGVHYSDTFSNIAFSFNMISMAAQTAFSFIQEGWSQTVGVAEQYQGQMDDMHNMFGISIEDAQKWRSATVATDTDMGSLMVTMRYLTQRVSDQSESGKNLRDSLESIGVSAKNLNGEWKDSSTLLQEVIVALNKIPEGSERANAASEILGRNWYRLADMIENADVAVETFQQSHATMTEEESEKIEKFKIKWAQLAEKIELAKVNLGLWIVESVEAEQQMSADSTVLDRLLAGRGVEAFFPTVEDWAGASKSGIGGGADYSGKMISETTTMVTSTENLFLAMTTSEREIAYMEQVVIPKYTEALKEAEEAGEGVTEAQYNLATALDKLDDLKTQDTDQTKAQVDAYKEYQAAIEKVNDLQEKQIKNEALLAYDLEIAMSKGDVVAARSAVMSYNRNQIDAGMNIVEAQSKASIEAEEYNQIRVGVPLEQVSGTSQYEKAQALAAGDLVIHINANLSPDYTIKDVISDSRDLRQLRISMGGRVRGS